MRRRAWRWRGSAGSGPSTSGVGCRGSLAGRSRSSGTHSVLLAAADSNGNLPFLACFVKGRAGPDAARQPSAVRGGGVGAQGRQPQPLEALLADLPLFGDIDPDNPAKSFEDHE